MGHAPEVSAQCLLTKHGACPDPDCECWCHPYERVELEALDELLAAQHELDAGETAKLDGS